MMMVIITIMMMMMMMMMMMILPRKYPMKNCVDANNVEAIIRTADLY